MIEVRGLTKRFGGVVAIDEVNFHLPPGSRTALLGANAAGKSTLLSVLSTLAAPSAGEARIGGEGRSLSSTVVPTMRRPSALGTK